MANFIDETYLKENTPVANNVDIQRIDFLFQDSINILINRRLGRSFTNYLDSVQNTTTDPIELEVIQLVKKCQAWYLAKNSIIVLANLNTNKGHNGSMEITPKVQVVKMTILLYLTVQASWRNT